MHKKVILDTDPGIDDAMALLYLNACEDLKLIAMTTTPGNADIDQCTRNALILCEMFGIDVPVHKGPPEAMNGTITGDYADFVHGADGLGDVGLPELRRDIASPDAAGALVALSRAHAGELTLLAVGRLTNVALAIQRDSGFAGRLKEIIIMGGAHEHPGNITPWAEANIVGDPEAAEVVFQTGVPLTMVGLDVTTQTRMSHGYLEPLAASLGGFGDFILAINKTYADYHVRTENRHDFPVHDSSAVAYATHPEWFGTLTGNLRCVLDGEQRGRTLFEESATGPHKVCMSVRSEDMLRDYADRVAGFYGR